METCGFSEASEEAISECVVVGIVWSNGSAFHFCFRSIREGRDGLEAWIGDLGVRRSGSAGGSVTSSFGGPVTLRIESGRWR